MTFNEFIQGVNNLSSKTHNKLVASGGTLVITDINNHAVEALSLIGITAATISVCTGVDGNNQAINFVSTYGWTSIGVGVPIIVPDCCKITSITLTTGSVALYLI